MSARAKRPTAKELKQPDEFVTATGKVVDWARENPDTVRNGAIAFVALLLVIIGVSWWASSRNSSANQQFYSASELYKAKQWQEAYDGFASLSNSLGGTNYGHLASLYAARSALKLDKLDDAIRFYNAYLGGSSTVALEQLARLNLGRALSKKGDNGAAKGELEKALALDGPAKPDVQIELASVEAASGAKDRAIELFTTYLTENPQGPAASLARNQILALGGTPPASPSGLNFGGSPIQIQNQ